MGGDGGTGSELRDSFLLTKFYSKAGKRFVCFSGVSTKESVFMWNSSIYMSRQNFIAFIELYKLFFYTFFYRKVSTSTLGTEHSEDERNKLNFSVSY